MAANLEEDPRNVSIPKQLPLLFLENQVVFPGAILPIRITTEPDAKLIDDVVMNDKLLALLTLRQPRSERTGLDDAYEIGAVSRVLQLQHFPDGSVNVAIQALKRFRVLGLVQREPYMSVQLEPLEDGPDDTETYKALVTAVKTQMNSLIKLSPNMPEAATRIIENIDDPGFLADLIAANLNTSVEEKQKLLETLDRRARLERLTYLLGREVEMMQVSNKIQSDVKSSIDKSQREFFLRQQLKAIQEELGEGEQERPEIKKYRESLEKLELSDEVRKEVTRELERLAQMNEASAEYHVISTYLDWIVELPWNSATEDQLDIDRAAKVLEEDHYGLSKVKQRILDFLAVRKLKADAAGPILCFIGPPGVGKTSLGMSIARALGRKFTRISLGGMRDEAEVRGHRKTYVGALPGRLIQNIRKVQSSNPVFMLDEIDKIGMDFRGDPASALLEVLDPAQNWSFSDHYLNVPFDLSKVMFIATGNVMDTIPWALRDRMETIEIPGYTTDEKMHIARRYLVPRQLDAHGIKDRKVTFVSTALREIIESYTREAGVRNLEREIANVCRGCARKFAQGRKAAVRVQPKDLRKYLGPKRASREAAERTRIPGVATGLAYTAVGGDILFIEASRMPGKGNLILTGQLGDVMKESAQAGLSYIRANAKKLGIADTDFSKTDIHVHVPAGAVPKDGPSAGVTLLTALVSLFVGKRVKNHLAMTGEITLRGMVLPVGGIKEKLLAAARGGIKEVILPDRCRPQLDEVPDTVKQKLKLHYVKRVDQVLDIALGQ